MMARKKESKEEGRTMTKKQASDDKTQVGYMKQNGCWVPRKCLPQGFWMKHEWGEYPSDETIDVYMDCIKPRALVKSMNKGVDNFHMSPDCCNMWFRKDRVKKYKIPGVYYRPINDKRDEVFIHRSLARKIRTAILTDRNIVWEIPAKELKGKNAKTDVQQTFIKPVLDKDLILIKKRVGGLQGNVTQLLRRADNLEKSYEFVKNEVAESKALAKSTKTRLNENDARVDELSKNFATITSWLYENFPNDFKKEENYERR